ncbi:MAG: N-acetylmuramoyl-L-alanine amidase-like domain-containing protein, partial [Myxococcota bacterium]
SLTVALLFYTRLRVFMSQLGAIYFFAIAAAIGPRTAAAGESAHTSEAPQSLPAKPYNLYSLLTHDDLVAEIEQRHDPSNWPVHLERVTRGLLAAPYLRSALGEERGIDRDPRFRLNAFDCTTFVETALALAHCDDYEQLKPLLDKIRYTGGRPTFQSRRHLITSQWIPELTAAGFVRDVTVHVGEEETKFIHLNLTKQRWQKRKFARTLPLKTEHVPFGHYDLPYLPIAVAKKRIRRIPIGTIVNVVRRERTSSPDVVTHQGLIVGRPGSRRRYVRHASVISKRVIDESLAKMLKRYSKPRKWPVVGINLLEIVPPSDRKHALPSATSQVSPELIERSEKPPLP